MVSITLFLVFYVYFHSQTIRAFSTDESICTKTVSIRKANFDYLSSQMLLSFLHWRGSSQGRQGVCCYVGHGGGVPSCL